MKAVVFQGEEAFHSAEKIPQCRGLDDCDVSSGQDLPPNAELLDEEEVRSKGLDPCPYCFSDSPLTKEDF